MPQSKELRFEYYRYQMNPIRTTQLELFGENVSFEELKERKNSIFASKVLEAPPEKFKDKGSYIQKRHLLDGDYCVIKFAAEKKLRHVKENLEEETIEDYPFVYVVINNHPSTQIIAVSHNYKAFQSTETVTHVLEKWYGNILQKHNLSFAIRPILDQHEYWSVLEKYRNRITQIRFEIIRPNITNIEQAIKDGIGEIASSTNSLTTKVELNAPKGQILEDIDAQNKSVAVLSEYSAEGGGLVSLKAKGIKRRIKTSQTIRNVKIDSLSIEGKPNEVIDVFKSIVSEE